MFDHLFQPITIGNVRLENRLFTAPISYALCDKGGHITERAYQTYAELAGGGWGLVCVEASYVREDGFCYNGFMGACPDRHFPGLGVIAEAIHENGAKCALQLVHGGRSALRRHTGIQPVAPSDSTPDWPPDGSNKSRGLRPDEIEDIIDCFAMASAQAKEVGFDMVLLHGAHGFLIAQFQSRLTNHRTDTYGPETAFTMELIKRVKQAVGPGFPIGLRISGDEYLGPDGITLEQNLRMLPEFVAAGLDYIDINAGSRGSGYWIMPSLYMPHGCNIAVSEAIKKTVNVPVIVSGRINDPRMAEEIIAKARADAVAMGRGSVCDPQLAQKAKEGRLEDIRRCVGCNLCAKYLSRGFPIRCAVNYDVGRYKWETDLKPALNPKKVLVIGGGPGGMEAARVAGLRGHRITLWEKGGALGGNLLPASVPEFKDGYATLITYLGTQMKKLDVTVELNSEATLERIKEADPDAVVIATGSIPVIPDIPGIERENVGTATDFLLGKRKIGETSVIIGGGLVGTETALYYARKGKKVIIVEMLPMDRVAAELTAADRYYLLQMLKEYHVEILAETKPLEITDKGIVSADRTGKRIDIRADSVIFATGFSPNHRLLESLKGKISRVYGVGDCLEPRLVVNAIWEGSRIARLI